MAAADVVVKCEEFIDNDIHPEDGNSTYFNIYESRDDIENENDENRKDDNENYENDDIKMQALLREFDLEILFTLLKFGDITYRSLKYISENDINAAIRSIAYRAEFREKLFAWRRDKYGLNDFSVLPPPKTSSSVMPLGVNNSNNILTPNINTNNTNAPSRATPSTYDHMTTTTTNTKQQPSGLAPRTKRLSTPKTNSAKKPRITNQTQERHHFQTSNSPPPPRSPTPTASQCMTSPTPTLSDSMSLLQQDTSRIDSHPSTDYDDPLCYQPTTSSAAAAATQATGSMKSDTSAPPYAQPKMAFEKLIKMNKKLCITYDKATLENALHAIRNGMTYSRASLQYNIPRTTLFDKLKKKYNVEVLAELDKKGEVLNNEEEQRTVEWIMFLVNAGFNVTECQVLESVATLSKKFKQPNLFKNGVSGRSWFAGFLFRHPHLAQRIASQNDTKSTRLLSEVEIKTWFQRVEVQLIEQKCLGILYDPKRIFNCDERGFYFNPNFNKAIENKTTNRIVTDDKERLTVVFTIRADGEIIPCPLVLFPYTRISEETLKIPERWELGIASSTGWLTSKGLFAYITNVFYKWLKEEEVTLPVVLFLNASHSSHLSLPLVEFCRKEGIILMALLPNLLQPIDVAFFEPLKQTWIDSVHNWNFENQDIKTKEEDFTPLIKKCIDDNCTKASIQKGFELCGLYPFDMNKADFGSILM